MSKRSNRRKRNQFRRDSGTGIVAQPATATWPPCPGTFTSNHALLALQLFCVVDGFQKQTQSRKEFWTVDWVDLEKTVPTAMCVTQYRDGSGGVPFGLQDDMIRQGFVDFVALICRAWRYYFRIPAADFRTFRTTIDEGRRYFQVNRDSQLSSDDTQSPIDLSEYRYRIDALG